MDDTRFACVMGGGTFYDVRAHFSLATRAFGETARKISAILTEGYGDRFTTLLQLTRMADHTSALISNQDVTEHVDSLLGNPNLQAMVFNVALCDFEGQVGDIPSGKTAPRLESRDAPFAMTLTTAAKVINVIKSRRPDVFVVGFKTTTNADVATQQAKALRQIEESGSDLVIANDIATRENLLVSRLGTVRATRDEILAQACRDIASHIAVSV